MKRALFVAVSLSFGLLLLAPMAPASEPTTGLVAPLTVEVDGELAHGLIGTPSGDATALVLVLHGYGHQAESHRDHLQTLADMGAIGVAMDYSGPQEGFPLANGARDSCSAFAPLAAAHPDVPSILYSVSMGTAVAALVFQECPLFDWWVNNEGLAMLHETWAGASALYASGNPTAVNAKNGIEAECGGTPATAPECYLARSMALQVESIPTWCVPSLDVRCLRGVYLTHGLNDGLVPYNQGREMVAALRAHFIPADFYTVVRGNVGGEGTTITGYAGQNVDGLAGHGTESNDAHALTALSFRLLYDLVRGDLAPPTGADLVVDRDAGTLP